MYSNVVGVSILTNGNRLDSLKRCISSLLANCHYRPLQVSILNNGSTDGTKDWLNTLRPCYGVNYSFKNIDKDVGCAAGTNLACEMVKELEFSLHIESDFELLPEEETGEDKLWLRRAIEFMQTNKADYLYARRMVDERDMMMHWWAQWMPRIDRSEGKYMHCNNFWWSNNPHIQRNSVMYSRGTLPLNETIDGRKGTSNWSQPELLAKQPGETWIHKWGLFVHEYNSAKFNGKDGCDERYAGNGRPSCKYGFYKDGGEDFCKLCNRDEGFSDMEKHADRWVKFCETGKMVQPKKIVPRKTVIFHTNQLWYRGTDISILNFAKYNEGILGNKSMVLVPKARPKPSVDYYRQKFNVIPYEGWDDAEKIIQSLNPALLHISEEGYKKDRVSSHARTGIHVIFPVVEEYGDVYAYVSEWLSEFCTKGRLPWVPLMVLPPVPAGNLRAELGLKDEMVFGSYGGPEAFDNPIAIDAIKHMAKERPDIKFLFMNHKRFCNSPNIGHLEGTIDPVKKAAFINTCDAMLHGRKRGETFGLAVAEFSAAGRPVVTWDGSVERAHLGMLGDKAILYSDTESLCIILRDLKRCVGSEWDVYTKRFSPEIVMEKFRKVYLE